MPNALHLFTLGTIPVYANIWFALILGFLAMNQPGPGYSLAVVAAWSVSLLVHEFGHALVARRYGLQPQILLHGIGGLCFHEPISSDRKNAFIIAAGPGLEIAFGLLILALQKVVESAAPEMIYQAVDANRVMITPFGYLLEMTVYLSIIWGLINLIPLHPLDGGQLFRLFMRRKQRPAQAERTTHIVSIAFAVGGAAWGLSVNAWFVVIMALFLAYTNFEALNALGMANPALRKKKNEFADALVGDAEKAFADGDWYEAARLAHQVRDQANTPEKVQGRAFEIIVLANVELEYWDEAAGFVDHAPDTPAIRAARPKIEAGLEKQKAEGW